MVILQGPHETGDLKKAYDMVPHEALFLKLERAGEKTAVRVPTDQSPRTGYAR